MPSPAPGCHLIFVLLFFFPFTLLGVTTFLRLYPEFSAFDDVAQTPDGGYITNYPVKFDSLGNIEWVRRLPAYPGWRFFDYRSVCVAADSNYIIGGMFGDSLTQGLCDAVIIKMKANSSGIIWVDTFRCQSGENIIDAIAPTPDGGCYACGRVYSQGAVVRMDGDGRRRWVRTWGNPWGHYMRLLLMSDGGCVAVNHRTFGINEEERIGYELIRFDSLGNQIWYFEGKPPLDVDCAFPYVFLRADGNIVVTGFGSFLLDSCWLYVNLHNPETGTRFFEKRVLIRHADVQRRVCAEVFSRIALPTPDTGFVVLGMETPDLYRFGTRLCLVKFNSRVESVWTRIYSAFPGPEPQISEQDILRAVSTRDGGFCATGFVTDFSPGTSSAFLLKTDSLGMLNWVKVPMRSCTTSIRLEITEKDSSLIHPRLYVSPNPFTKSARIHYQLPSASQVLITAIDITGRTVATLVEGYQPAGNHQLRWHPERLAQGIYFIKLQTPDFQLLHRTILLP